MTRTAKVVRATAETDIGLSIDLDGTGAADVETGVGFFDHMLCALARHSMIDLTLRVKGDTYVDDHHTVEDTGIVMGQALREALGDKRGIRRFGSVMVPRSTRPWSWPPWTSSGGESSSGTCHRPQQGGQLRHPSSYEFFAGLARDAGITLHLRLVCGERPPHSGPPSRPSPDSRRGAVGRLPLAGAIPSTRGLS